MISTKKRVAVGVSVGLLLFFTACADSELPTASDPDASDLMDSGQTLGSGHRMDGGAAVPDSGAAQNERAVEEIDAIIGDSNGGRWWGGLGSGG